MTPLHELAALLGVMTRWSDQHGQEHVVGDATLLALVRMLGADVATPGDAAEALDLLRAERAQTMLPAVIVVWDGSPVSVPLRLPRPPRAQQGSERAAGVPPATVVIEYEDGRVVDVAASATAVEIPAGVPSGMHRVVVECGDHRAAATVIAAPSRITGPDVQRVWGLFAPVYALHDRRRSPDLGTLRRFADWASARGAAVVGTLPILATFVGHGNEPLDPSPYQPVSRRFWNEAYIDLDAIALEDDQAPQLAQYVDVPALSAARRARVERAAGASVASPEFEAWLDNHPDALDYARFRAVLEGEGDDAVQFHAFAQWQMERQLGGLAHALHERGQALCLDLPVGAHPDGYDVVSQPDLFLRDASVGAPPDAFQVAGQDWGFPPIDPTAARRSGYRYLRACLDAHLRFARFLRVDHVMGLHRLWVIPRGFPATEGAYVRYAAEEQWAVVCLAAAQRGAGIVGENLGTVPDETNAALERHGALGSWVAEFDLPEPPPRQSSAGIGTHDLPTFATWWHDLSPADRGELLGVLRDIDALDENYGDLLEPHEVLEALLAWLGASEAEVVMVTLEDLWLEADAQNEPGSQTHQNFCRRAAYGLDELDSVDHLKRTLERLDAARRRA